MSPRKLTEDDKQEILQLYRNSEATTSTLANRYEVSSSTISRFLKNKLSTTEYEDLIQQKRLARTPRGEKNSEKKTKKKTTKPKSTKTTKAKKTRKKSDSKAKVKLDQPEITETPVLAVESTEIGGEPQAIETPPKSALKRRRRRRSSVTEELQVTETQTVEAENLEDEVQNEASDKPEKLVIDSKVETSITDDNPLEKPAKNNNLVLKSDKPKVMADASFEDEDEEDEDEDEVDLMTLKEMLGEDLEDINDEEDEEDDDDWEEEDETSTIYSKKDGSFHDLEILPLAQANFPRICYLVIDRSAELIVKPLAEFADLGEIPQDEIKQVTLPVFDNHRIAKRFSHRRERVIKVPDGRMLQKTSRHLQEKGISRLLMDGQIYSI